MCQQLFFANLNLCQVKYRYSFLYDEKAQHFMRKLTFFVTLFVLRLGGYFLLKKKRLGGYLVFTYFNLFTNSFYFINSLTSFNIFNLIVVIENHFLQLLILIINYNCNAPDLYHFYFFPLLEFRYSKLSFSHIQNSQGCKRERVQTAGLVVCYNYL